MARWKHGAPKKLYVVVDQEYGEIEAYDKLKDAKLDQFQLQLNGVDSVLVTFIQEEKDE